MAVETVNLQIKAGKLLDLYRRLFKERFGQDPVTHVTDDTEDLRWVVSSVGFDRAYALLESYFLIQDEWVAGQGFSIRWFKNNINRIITQSAPSKKPGSGLNPGTRRIHDKLYCDACWEPFSCSYSLSDNIDQLTINCPDCQVKFEGIPTYLVPTFEVFSKNLQKAPESELSTKSYSEAFRGKSHGTYQSERPLLKYKAQKY